MKTSHLYRSVHINHMQHGLLDLRQEFGEEQQDLLAHSRRILCDKKMKDVHFIKGQAYTCM